MGFVKDINDLIIDSSLPKKERIKSYLEQMENPYAYEDNGTMVRLRFAETNESLTDRILSVANTMNTIG